MEVTATLTDKQYDIYNNIVASVAKYHIINASRQAGKSVLDLHLLLGFAINDPSAILLFISPVHSQNKKIYHKALRVFEDIGLLQQKDSSNLELYLNNDTIIKFRSAERYNNIRGESADYIFCDEFSFMKKEAWDSAIRPVANARPEAKVVITSTPKGKNEFYKLAVLGMGDNSNYQYYMMNYNDNPFYDIKEVEDAKKTLPDGVFRTEYLAEFIDSGSVFTNLTECSTITKYKEFNRKDYYFAGLDFGKTTDSTVLTIMDSSGEVVCIYRDKSKQWSSILTNIVQYLDLYKPLVYVEANNGTVNDPLFEKLSEMYSNLIPFQNNNSSKNDIVETLVLSLNELDIKLPTEELDKELALELSSFSFTYSPKTRKVIYSAPQGLHDDMVISLCLANKCRILHAGNNTYSEFQSYRDNYHTRPSDDRW